MMLCNKHLKKLSSYSFKQIQISLSLFLLASFTACSSSGDGSNSKNTVALTETELGEALFFDTNLSLQRTQSCATCHNPEAAFTDNRTDAQGNVTAFSLGDDGISLGDRNAPSATYASLSPPFGYGTRTRINSKQSDYTGYLGGQFWDGRAIDLAEQAGGPPLNPIEMGMPDKTTVVDRIQENVLYVNSMQNLYGENIFTDIEAAYSALTQAIATFEQTPEFSPFDSKYDRSLRGEYQYGPLSKAALGKSLFFSQQFTNCSTCHQLNVVGHKREPFTSYEFHNIGVPANTFDRALAGKEVEFLDAGLNANDNIVQDETLKGKFKVPTLRNSAVTAPYMHNGVFKNLRTVIQFYDHLLDGSEHTLNPETGEPWAAPEFDQNISEDELRDGDLLTEDDIDALVCFIRTLTDARYEHLIPEDDIDCE